jgi:hypothetical protein
MFFNCSYGTLCGIVMVVVRLDQLDVHLVGLDVLLNHFGALIVYHIQCWLVVASTEYHKHFGEGGNEQGVSAGWHWSHDDCVKVADVRDKDILHVLE